MCQARVVGRRTIAERGKKKKKGKREAFFVWTWNTNRPSVQNEIGVKFISTNGRENGRILVGCSSSPTLSCSLLFPLLFNFPPLWEERKFLPLPPLIHSLLPFSMQCHRRHFNSRHDALVFFRVRPTDYKMDVGRLMKYLKVSSGENPRER